MEGPFGRISTEIPVVRLVDRDRSLLVEAAGLVVPVGTERPKLRFYGSCVVSAEKQLTAGGSENNPDVRLCPATVTPVNGG